jgi:hypothetical protein
MKITHTLLKGIKNVRDGFHLNSAHWQNYKATITSLTPYLFSVAVGMIISDATMYRMSTEALIKFEQGYLQRAFVDHLFELFKGYCFMTEPGERLDTSSGIRKGAPKSYWFKTFSHSTFTTLWDIFYHDNKKVITPGLVQTHVNDVALAYWIMGDGSLNGRIMTLNTQGFSYDENLLISVELNAKFGFHSEVIKHKGKYWVVRIPGQDASALRALIVPHMLPIFAYKIPRG